MSQKKYTYSFRLTEQVMDKLRRIYFEMKVSNPRVTWNDIFEMLLEKYYSTRKTRRPIY